MTLLIQKQPTNGYSTIVNGDTDTDTATVPRVITRRSTWTTVRSRSGAIAIVAGMLLLVVGGVVWMTPDGGSSNPTAAGDLVVATIEDTLDTAYYNGDDPTVRCFPATGNFQLTSTTST